jgi:hypothetical protein
MLKRSQTSLYPDTKMPCYQEITCPRCQSNHITQSGPNAKGEQRYHCQQVNPNIGQLLDSRTDITVELIAAFEVEMNEPWSYVAHKGNQHQLWYAFDHLTNTVLAYVFGQRKENVFKQLKQRLEPFRLDFSPKTGGLINGI